MKKLIVLISLLLSVSVFALSAEGTDSRSAFDCESAIGVAYYSPDIGGGSDNFLGGLCYQHWINEKTGIEFGGAISWDPNSTYKPLDYNIYCEGDYILYQSEISHAFASRLYTWGLVGHTGAIESEYDMETESYKETGYRPNFRAGIGFGFDLIFYKHVSVPLKFGFTGSLTGAGFTFGGGIKYIW